MRKIDISNYLVTQWNPDGTSSKRPYDVRNSLVEICFLPTQGCKPLELFKREKIAKKIAEAPTDTILLEETEWQRLNDALNHVPGLGQQEIELAHRIVEAPIIEVGEVNTTANTTLI